jgi:hypothetical protein
MPVELVSYVNTVNIFKALMSLWKNFGKLPTFTFINMSRIRLLI